MTKKIGIFVLVAIAAMAIAFSFRNRGAHTGAGLASSEEATASRVEAKGAPGFAVTSDPRNVPAGDKGTQDALDRASNGRVGNAHPTARELLFAGDALNVERVKQLSNDQTFDLLYADLVRSADAEHLALGRSYSSQLSRALAESGHGQQLERFACASQICLGEVRSDSEDTSGLLVELAALSESGRMPIGVMSFASAGFDRPNSGRIRVVLSPSLTSMTARPDRK